MNTTADATGIWSHWKLIIGVLSFLFVVAVAADVALWYSLNNKSNTAVETLNDIIARQPPAPKTDVDKIKLLDSLASAHAAAVAQVDAQSSKKTTVSSEITDQAKIQLLDSFAPSR